MGMKRLVILCALLGAACTRYVSLVGTAQPGLMRAVATGSMGWALQQGCGGIAYHCTAAASLSVPTMIALYDDGTMEQYRGGVKVASGTFTLIPSATDSLRSGTLIMKPGLEAATDTLALSFSIEGELMLAEPCCDRLTYSFLVARGPD